MDRNIVALQQYLAGQQEGPVGDRDRLLGLLERCWDSLDGSEATRMEWHKLHRIDDPIWSPPALRFRIERHGSTVNGSSRAALHTWEIIPAQGTARIVRETHRQLYPQAARLNVKPIAVDLCAAIIEGRTDPRLQRRPDGSVAIAVAAVIPATNKQTTADRRRRLRTALRGALSAHGWREVSVNRYAPTE